MRGKGMIDDYIAIDWGSTQLRAWHVQHGDCIHSLNLPVGVSRLKGQAPRDIFQRYIAPWRGNRNIPVMMAGMIGSEAGWQTVPYLDCPVRLEDIGSQCQRVDENVWIVPGLKTVRDGACNVMRGEETQLLGAAQLSPASCYVLPGTHCKWVWSPQASIEDFTTVMTGELHHLLLSHSLIGHALPEQQEDAAAFRQGLATGVDSPALLPKLFETRARWLLGALKKESVSDYLSGLLIGAELATQTGQRQPSSVTLVGAEPLLMRYQAAFDLLGITVSQCSGDSAFLQGIKRIINDGY
ncbi:2-keto-3-deoxy-galactonokinase [Serratia odorifera]|uniref:2-dehydro-3-deoxygalactonokinase n=2 Tax=Serratia odorifera TaxID=618 RepID=D4E4C7_SEROD|nr:2-dehydro-3-deoxygalactonokinase [Serratia odorifera DSM 4582]VDZ61133.1 2-keto-3-deoxy-galactonokinase [Serratia odorifera]